MGDFSLTPEPALLKRLQQGDQAALASLMRMYYDDLYHYASRFTRDHALVKDCIQEVFISLWQRRDTIGAIISPRNYLLRAIKNKTLKALHKNATMQVLPVSRNTSFCMSSPLKRSPSISKWRTKKAKSSGRPWHYFPKGKRRSSI